MSLATPSGKSAATENFPVASLLVRAELRGPVHAFYRFARMGDDIADNPVLPPEEKLRRLDAMGAVLTGTSAADVPEASDLRASLAQTGTTPTHALELLDAFRMDATKLRYADWDELMGYCRLSAAPVGRHVLDLHGEDPQRSWPPSDALCAALQIINHLQDCADDHRQLDRVYLPLDVLARHGTSVDDLQRPAATPGLRAALAELTERTAALLEQGAPLPARIRDHRLKAETGAILRLARGHIAALRTGDPLARSLKMPKGRFVRLLLQGALQGLFA